jgi:hypothetical protein
MKDFTAAALALVVIGALVTYTISHLVGEGVKWYWSVKRLRNALVIEALVTINKLETIISDIATTLERLERSLKEPGRTSKALTTDEIQSISSGYVIVPPSVKLEDLVPIAFEAEGKIVIHFLDTWRRLIEYERRLGKVHEQLLKAADAPSSNVASLEEYSEQAIGILRKFRRTAAELIVYSIRAIRYEKPNISEHQLRELSDGIYSSKQEMDEDYEYYVSVWESSTAIAQGQTA